MELKFHNDASGVTPEWPFNRTIVELKLNIKNFALKNHLSFNRTIVELKFDSLSLEVRDKLTFNRTIVELKYTGQIRQPSLPLLLTEP